MKKIILFAGALLASGVANATYFQAPEMDDAKVVNPDSTGFTFTDVKNYPYHSGKRPEQIRNMLGVLRNLYNRRRPASQRQRELDLSEMFVVRNAYIDKAKNISAQTVR